MWDWRLRLVTQAPPQCQCGSEIIQAARPPGRGGNFSSRTLARCSHVVFKPVWQWTFEWLCPAFDADRVLTEKRRFGPGSLVFAPSIIDESTQTSSNLLLNMLTSTFFKKALRNADLTEEMHLTSKALFNETNLRNIPAMHHAIV